MVVFSVLALLLVAVAPIGSAESDSLRVPEDVVRDLTAAKGESAYIIIMEGDPLVATVGVDRLDSPRGRFQKSKLERKQERALKKSGADADSMVY